MLKVCVFFCVLVLVRLYVCVMLYVWSDLYKLLGYPSILSDSAHLLRHGVLRNGEEGRFYRSTVRSGRLQERRR